MNETFLSSRVSGLVKGRWIIDTVGAGIPALLLNGDQTPNRPHGLAFGLEPERQSFGLTVFQQIYKLPTIIGGHECQAPGAGTVDMKGCCLPSSFQDPVG